MSRMVLTPRPPLHRCGEGAWIPACAGMTSRWARFIAPLHQKPPLWAYSPPASRGDGRSVLHPYGLAHTYPPAHSMTHSQREHTGQLS